MNASESFGAPAVKSIDGNDVEFPRLKMPQYAMLEDAARQANAMQLRSQLDECQVGGAQRFPLIRDAERIKTTYWDVDMFLRTQAGARRALELSLKLSGKSDTDAKTLIDSFQMVEASDLARELVGFVKTSEDGFDGKDGKSDPQ